MSQLGDLLDGRYQIDQRIGQGGMGEVWVATDRRLGRTVAVKTVATDATDAEGDQASAADLARFQREAQATAGVNHPNVVTVFDSGIDGRTAYLVMEYLPGADLATRLVNDGPMPVRRALAAGAEIASGLAAAHAAGVIHRDIKPGNVMFGPTGEVKVVDFGIAALAHGGGTSAMTSAGTILGSAPYLSPEQAEGYPATERSDLYALGCCLMAMLTGQPPFTGEHPLSLLRAHMDSAPPLVSERRPEVSREVDDLVDELLAKDPRDRPSSAREVADRLESLARGEVVPRGTAVAGGVAAAEATQMLATGRPGRATSAMAVGPLGRPVGEPAAVAAPGASPAPETGERRRRGWMPWVTGLLVLALLGTLAAIAWMLLRPDDPSEPVTPPPVSSSTTSSTAPTSSSSTTTTSSTASSSTTPSSSTTTTTSRTTTSTSTSTTTTSTAPPVTSTPPAPVTTEPPTTVSSTTTPAPTPTTVAPPPDAP